jgi:broad specificity phosphatase PhoE
MQLILIRHGETQENVDGIVQGWFDSVLNDKGRQQAQSAANNFNAPIKAIYSSDLKRCLQTAEYFSKKYLDIPFHTDERLRERNFGDAQNTHKVLHDWEVFWASKDKVSIPNAETLNEFTHRVKDFLQELKKKHHNNEKILVVTHGGTINRILDILNINNNYQAIKNCESIFVELTEK